MLRVPGVSPASKADPASWRGQAKFMEGDARMRRTILFTATVMATAGAFVFGGTAEAGRPGTGAIRGLTLTPPRDGTSEHQCIRGLGEPLIKWISGNPIGYYADAHNDAFSDGAISGQLTQGGPR
jgi:hypothetical protein